MDANEFNCLSKKCDKIAAIQTLPAEEIGALVKSLQAETISNWNNCIDETKRKILTEPAPTEARVLHSDFMLSQAKWAFKKYSYNTVPNNMNVIQWDIFFCDLGHNIGREKNKCRPVLVIQNMIDYRTADTVIVVPITTTMKKTYRHEIILPSEQTINKIHGVIDLAQIRAVSKLRLKGRNIGRLLKVDEYRKFCEAEGKDFKLEDMVSYKVKRELKRLFNLDN